MTREPERARTATRAAVVVTVLLALAACSSPMPSPSPSPSAPPEHRVGVVDGVFVDRDADGTPFVPRGVDYFRIVRGYDSVFALDVYDRDRMDADFAALAAAGYNTVRIFLDSCRPGPLCIATEGQPGLNGDYLANVAEATRLARDHGLVLLLTSNDLPDGGRYRDISGQGTSADFAGYRNTDFLTASGHAAEVAYWEDLMAGLAEHDAAFDAVLGWSILNEEWVFGDQPPLSLKSGTVASASGTYDMGDPEQRRAMVADSLRAMISDVASTIRSHDPDGLVTMGFFSPQFPNATSIGGTWYVDTVPLVESSDLDFFDFHAYPGLDLGIADMAENFGIADAKPVVMGEVGAFTDLYDSSQAAGLAVQRWIAESCDAGFDGWLYWGYIRGPVDDATWGLTEDDGYLFDALAPANQPDPCTPSLVDPNLAHERPTTASSTRSGFSASGAVDEDPRTRWDSGQGASQWIQVDLGGATVTTIRLVVAQFPAGHTIHVVEATTPSGTREVGRFDGETDAGDVLEATLDPPLEGVQSIRVTTIESPSWVAWTEIEVE